LRKAKAAIQPARVGIGAGHMDLNAQRYGFTSSEAGFHTVDENGLSDRTIWVIKPESLSGEPIHPDELRHTSDHGRLEFTAVWRHFWRHVTLRRRTVQRQIP
jgi:hypothetical protein